MNMRIPRLNIKILLESNPPKFRVLVRRLAVIRLAGRPACSRWSNASCLPVLQQTAVYFRAAQVGA